MPKALIIGSSGGIGAALKGNLQQRGYAVRGLSRSQDELDITNESSIEAHLSQVEGEFDLVIIATGALSIEGHGPEKSLGSIRAEAMTAQFMLNSIGPILVLKHAKRLLPRHRRAVFAALSARVGSIGDNHLGGWYSYRASKAGLNQLIRTASIELKRTHRHLICVSLHPGTVATKFTEAYRTHPTVSPDEAASNLLGVIDGLTEEDTGSFLDWAGKRVVW